MTTIALPRNVLDSDLRYPDVAYDAPDAVRDAKRIVHTFTMHYTTRFGWVLNTLEISRARRGSSATTDRSYGIAVDTSQLVRTGMGPHVKSAITIYVRRERLPALQYLVDLHEKGMEGASDARDRRSTRALNTRARRNSLGSWFGGL